MSNLQERCTQPDEAKLPIISSDAAYGQEIKEGFLHCSTCETTYPVIAGVAVLVQNPLTYIHARERGQYLVGNRLTTH